MSYRKLKATGLFTGYELMSEGPVLVTREDGTIVEILLSAEAGEGVEVFEGILCPGFVNCHCHLELSHLKGLIPQKTGLVDFVYKVITERHFPEETIFDAINQAENELIATGTVAVGDICNNLLTIPQKKKQRLAYYNFIEVSGWLPEVAPARFERSWSIYESFTALQNSIERHSLSPHAPYSVSNDLWALLVPYFEGKTITIHNQETAWENELFVSGTGDARRMYELMKIENPLFRPGGKSSLQTYLPRMEGSRNLLLVHNTFTTADDMQFSRGLANAANHFFCLCLNANLYIEDRLPPVELLRSAGVNLVMGTDSLASNHSLDLLQEIKTLLTYFPAIPTAEILRWCTLNGAEALQMEDSLGSFETGKKPGVLLLEGTPANSLNANTTVKRLI